MSHVDAKTLGPLTVTRPYRYIVGTSPDYNHYPSSRGWGAGWPTSRYGDMANVLIPTTITGGTDGSDSSLYADNSTQSFLVHKAVAKLIEILLNETQRRGYKLIKGWCWSYENRAIGGTQNPSNHSWGLAIDLNAPHNPYTSPRVTDMPLDWMPDLWARYGFAWGGDYTDRQDSMHYEFMGTVTQAAEALVAAQTEITGTQQQDLETWMATQADQVKAIVVSATSNMADDVNILMSRTAKLMHAMSRGTDPSVPPDKESMPTPPYSTPNQVAKLRDEVANLQKSVNVLQASVAAIQSIDTAQLKADLLAAQQTQLDTFEEKLMAALVAGKLASPDIADAVTKAGQGMVDLGGTLNPSTSQ